MSKKLSGNGLFESSRMMLPEHKEAYLEHQRSLGRQTRPQLDEQETERIFRLVAEAVRLRRELRLVLFGEFRHAERTGLADRIDPQRRAVRFAGPDGEYDWISMEDIVDADFAAI